MTCQVVYRYSNCRASWEGLRLFVVSCVCVVRGFSRRSVKLRRLRDLSDVSVVFLVRDLDLCGFVTGLPCFEPAVSMGIRSVLSSALSSCKVACLAVVFIRLIGLSMIVVSEYTSCDPVPSVDTFGVEHCGGFIATLF